MRITESDVVRVDYCPVIGAAITDSSALRNPVRAFTDTPADNRVSEGAGRKVTAARLVVCDARLTRRGDVVRGVVQIQNQGSEDADAAQILSASLDNLPARPLAPLTLGTIPPGVCVAVSLSWASPRCGIKTTLKITGDCQASSFSSSLRVTLP